MFEPTPNLTWLHFLVNFVYELGSIITRYDVLDCDCEQYSNGFQLDLISPLVNFSYTLGQIITRYDFLEARDERFWTMFEPTPNLAWLHFLVNLLYELGSIISKYDVLEAR